MRHDLGHLPLRRPGGIAAPDRGRVKPRVVIDRPGGGEVYRSDADLQAEFGKSHGILVPVGRS